jgi:predicted phosphoadenosine phosphosulfate sulfurtransferase
MAKRPLPCNVLEAAQTRIALIFSTTKHIYLSFSGGKDSSVMMHLVCDEARRQNRKIGILFIDWECQFKLTVDHIQEMLEQYKDVVVPYWICGQVKTDNSSSVFEPEFTAWDETKRELWVRDKPAMAYPVETLPFYYPGITFEEFAPEFSKWYSQGETSVCFVGIRTQESLNRFRAIARNKVNYLDQKWTTQVSEHSFNAYPIYDWTVNDIWTYNQKMKTKYNHLYDLMYQSGLTVSMMRVDEPFGDTQKRSLWLYQVVEPETWAKLTARISGVNTSGLYGKEKGLINGNGKLKLPEGYTWKQFTHFLLDTMPPRTAEHYKAKFAIYIKWWQDRGYPDDIPDKADDIMESRDLAPSWCRLAKTILRGDFWCRWLGFSPTKTKAYAAYLELAKKRRKDWNIFNEDKATSEVS